MSVEIKLAYDNLEAIGVLFLEYFESIIAAGPDIRKCLELQDYGSETKNLDKKYELPNNRLYIAYLEGEYVGCVGLLKIDDEYCELKRLYVREDSRKNNIGTMLVDRVIADAKEIGYKYMRLDTFPSMRSAIKLYERYGFYRIDCYNENDTESAIFMQLDL
ncbi:GNAT family N-acetyltransferase [Peptostreptococcus faecalis]|uniref:GNAT family N-acetyltransferase n=1 Tax=Peptostreptococcus faecalis TaxID=2045015 RepID=UPI000C79BBE8|nr:GNAT family N-acetyltransferase [Peptostreptococcus faecalis]